jgi:hypothetical protein
MGCWQTDQEGIDRLVHAEFRNNVIGLDPGMRAHDQAPFKPAASMRRHRAAACAKRLRVAAKTALATAATMADVPASPIPPGGSELWTMWTSMAGASWFARHDRSSA